MKRIIRGRRVGLAIVAIGVAAVAVTGASAKPTAKGPSPLSGQLRIASHTATKASMDALLYNFKIAYPNIKVDIQYIPTGPTLNTTLLTMINTGNAPDIFFSHPSPAGDVASRPLGLAGKLMDLSKRPFVKRIPKVDRAFFNVGGKVYVEPVYKVASGMNINMTTFKANGWKIPTTFAQLLSLCDKAKVNGNALIAFAGPVTAEAILNSLGATFVLGKDENWFQKKAQGKVSFSGSPLWNSLFQHAIALRDRGCFYPGWQAFSIPSLAALMAQRKVAITLAPSAGISSYKALLPNDEFVNAPVPGDKASDTHGMMGYNFGLAVSATTPNRAAALAFIDFAGREGQSNLQAKINGGSSLHQVNTGRLPAALAPYAPFVKADKIVARPDSQFPTSTTNSNFNTVAGEILINGKPINDALKLLDDTWGK